MSEGRALPFVLRVLDDGIRLYRRHLASFLMVATAVLVALALIAMSFMAFVRTEIGDTGGWTFLAFLVLLLFSYPVVIYAFAALSRTTLAAINREPIALLPMLRIAPGRGCGMMLFNLLWTICTSIAASILAVMISCPISYVSLIVAGLTTAVSDGGAMGAAFGLIGVTTQISWLWSLTMMGAWLASTVYAVQAFVQEGSRWSGAAGRSVDMLFTRFGRSLLMFLGAGAIFGTLLLVYLGSLIALLVFVFERLGTNWAPIVGDVIAIVVVVASLVVLLPPLAIWMALFYHRVAGERDGTDIEQRIRAWHEQTVHELV
jgi:hypothetical protein